MIGIFNNITSIDGNGNEKTESLVKIIRNESLGNYSWDTTDSTINSGRGVNEWSQADLMYELNCDGSGSTKYCRDDISNGYLSDLTSGTTYWYNGKSNSKTASYDYSKNIKSNLVDKIAIVRWNTNRAPLNGTSALNFYNQERSTTLIRTPSDNVPRNITWDGKIALIYKSDYFYASDYEICRNSASSCMNSNWLDDQESYHTFSPCSLTKYCTFYVKVGMNVYDGNASKDYGVRPTLFLKSYVMISGGEGTESNPYVID